MLLYWSSVYVRKSVQNHGNRHTEKTSSLYIDFAVGLIKKSKNKTNFTN